MYGNGHVVPTEPVDGSDKVTVRCDRCGESFFRERQIIHLGHNCSSYNPSDNLKWCCGCNTYCFTESFDTDKTRFDGLSRFCRECSDTNVLQHKAEWLVDKYNNELNELAGRSCLNITPLDIIKQYDLQDGQCYYTNIPLTFDDSERSIELKEDPAGGIILVCAAMVGPSGSLIGFILEAVKRSQYNIRMETMLTSSAGQLPFRKRISDAGYDLHSAEDITIKPKTSANVDTGIIVCPPEGAYYTIEGRSSVFSRGVTPYRGIIDGTYQGPLKVILMNDSDESYVVHRGDRIAQLVLHPIVHGDFVLVNSFTPVKNGRQTSGWGSSGK